jgi:hypothetical protein
VRCFCSVLDGDAPRKAPTVTDLTVSRFSTSMTEMSLLTPFVV